MMSANSSAKSPRPEPNTRAMRERSLVLLRMNFAARSARINSALGDVPLTLDFFRGGSFRLTRIFRRLRPTADWPSFPQASRGYQSEPTDLFVRGPMRRCHQSGYR